MQPLRHLPDILQRMKERPRQADAFNSLKEGVWIHLSTEEVIRQIECLALALNKWGLEKGDRVGILAKSSPAWSIADLAIVIAGGITIPFFSNLSTEHFRYEIEETRPRWLFVGDQEDLDNATPFKDRFEGIVAMDDLGKQTNGASLQELLSLGGRLLKENPAASSRLAERIDPEDVATIIYSSGSTGYPKGVELTHKNLVSIVAYDEFNLKANDKYLSILPLAHIFAKQIHLIMMAWGVPIYFLNDPKQLTEVTAKIPITRMITVPRVLEKAYSKIHEQAAKGNFLKRHISKWALELAHEEGGVLKNLIHPLADFLVYSKIRKAFGPNFQSILSGGAALNPRLHRFFLNIGIPVLQGWGLTEGSCIAVNRPGQSKIGTVGPPVPSITFKISEEGEVLAKGPTMMKGYYKNEEATKKAIDSEGWLHTGDLGHLDEDGHLVIEGRMNETFKTSQGEFINPGAIEQKICESGLIEIAMVIGENRPFVSALLFSETTSLAALKRKTGAQSMSDQDFIKSDILNQEIDKILDKVNQDLDHWQKIRRYRLILDMPSIERGELTPTLKLRRKALHAKYEQAIEEMYQEQHPKIACQKS